MLEWLTIKPTIKTNYKLHVYINDFTQKWNKTDIFVAHESHLCLSCRARIDINQSSFALLCLKIEHMPTWIHLYIYPKCLRVH